MAERQVAQFKKDVVANITKLLVDSPIVGAVNMQDLPAPALQTMRSKLRGKAEIIMTKRRLMKIAIAEAEKTKKGISAIEPYLKGMPALLFTSENPFSIYKTIKKSKSAAPAKAGHIAPYDIEVKAGVTPFVPGPIIGELGAFGIKSGVEDGKVAIKEDAIVAKEGTEINQALAGILSRLGIEPMEVGLDITAIYEDGTIYDRKVLDIDEDQFLADLSQAATWARNLAIESGFPTKDTIADMIGLAFNRSKGLALEANIMASGVVDEILAKAARQGNALNALVKEPEAEDKKEEAKAEEPKVEDKKESLEKIEKVEEKKAEDKKEDKEIKTDNPKKEIIVNREVIKMEYVYAAMLIHKAGGKVDEATVKKVLEAAGTKADDARIKALVASLDGVNIDEAIEKASVAVAAPVAAAPAGDAGAGKADEKKADKKKDEEKSSEQAAAGLGALFG